MSLRARVQRHLDTVTALADAQAERERTLAAVLATVRTERAGRRRIQGAQLRKVRKLLEWTLTDVSAVLGARGIPKAKERIKDAEDGGRVSPTFLAQLVAVYADAAADRHFTTQAHVAVRRAALEEVAR